jgi:hypothetical protein
VLAASGGKATDAKQVTHGGYSAWAITVSRPDGSVVKGFVEVTSGVIFDWSVVSAPTQASPSKPYGDEDENEEYENEEYENEENENEENENEENEGGDDD